jgi:hypothetical protein
VAFEELASIVTKVAFEMSGEVVLTHDPPADLRPSKKTSLILAPGNVMKNSDNIELPRRSLT